MKKTSSRGSAASDRKVDDAAPVQAKPAYSAKGSDTEVVTSVTIDMLERVSLEEQILTLQQQLVETTVRCDLQAEQLRSAQFAVTRVEELETDLATLATKLVGVTSTSKRRATDVEQARRTNADLVAQVADQKQQLAIAEKAIRLMVVELDERTTTLEQARREAVRLNAAVISERMEGQSIAKNLVAEIESLRRQGVRLPRPKRDNLIDSLSNYAPAT